MISSLCSEFDDERSSVDTCERRARNSSRMHKRASEVVSDTVAVVGGARAKVLAGAKADRLISPRASGARSALARV